MDTPIVTNLGVLLDIPVRLSVELARSQKSTEELLRFAVGAIVELDHCASDPVTLCINGKSFACGKVVLTETNLAVKITELMK
jgi:flagellar motor switch protein FliN